MSCRQILELVDSLPFLEQRPARLVEIERHAVGCRACRRALTAAIALDRALPGLEEPEVPEELSAAIRRRLSTQIEESAEGFRSGEAIQTVVDSRRAGAPAVASGRRFAWMALLAGSVLAVVTVTLRWLGGDALLLLAPPALRSGMAGVLGARAWGAWGSAVVLGLALGLPLYVTGLFGLLRPRLGVGPSSTE